MLESLIKTFCHWADYFSFESFVKRWNISSSALCEWNGRKLNQQLVEIGIKDFSEKCNNRYYWKQKIITNEILSNLSKLPHLLQNQKVCTRTLVILADDYTTILLAYEIKIIPCKSREPTYFKTSIYNIPQNLSPYALLRFQSKKFVVSTNYNSGK